VILSFIDVQERGTGITLEFSRDRKSMGVLAVNKQDNQTKIFVKVHLLLSS
jgi:hypothetical protein